MLDKAKEAEPQVAENKRKRITIAVACFNGSEADIAVMTPEVTEEEEGNGVQYEKAIGGSNSDRIPEAICAVRPGGTQEHRPRSGTVHEHRTAMAVEDYARLSVISRSRHDRDAILQKTS